MVTILQWLAAVGMAPVARRRSPSSRRGFSLLEMLAVVAVSGVILWAAGTLTVSLLNLRAARRAEHDVHRSLLMLQQQWRQDVHAAVRGSISGEGAQLSLDTPAGSIVYRQDGSTLHRTVHDRGRLAGRDEFRLPEGSHVRWLWPTEKGAIATLAIDYLANPADPRSTRVRTLEAAVGMGERFGASPESRAKGTDDNGT